MRELRRIVETIENCDEPMAIATVVDVVGSAYRRPSARMLILPDGSHIGSISGGCLERDLCRDAFRLTALGPKLVSFDTREGSVDLNPRYDVGCSGIIYVLVERVTRDADCPARVLREVLRSKCARTVGTIYHSDPSNSTQLNSVGTRFDEPIEFCGGVSQAEVDAVWQEVKDGGNPICCELSSQLGSIRCLVEHVSPPKALWIFGGGDDARPLAAIANEMGWDVTVFDPRASQLSACRFPNVEQCCTAWHDALRTRRSHDNTAAVLMTHSFEADVTLMPSLLNANLSYFGVLGPKSRTGRVLRQLHADGRLPPAESLDQLRTPIGLDLGAQQPSEIAVSIIAEMIALDNSRDGGLLRERVGPIHEPVRHVLIEGCGAIAADKP